SDDRLVLAAQCRRERGEIGFLAVVIFVLHRPRDNSGRWCGQERLDEIRTGFVESHLEVGAFGLDRGWSQITGFSGRLWWGGAVLMPAWGERSCSPIICKRPG